MAALKIEIAGYANSNVFGWYDVTTGTQTVLFNGPAGAGATASFTPTANYGFYLISGNGDTYFTQSSKNSADLDKQHFALFEDGLSYWLGMEDLRFCGSDKDYQDMVVKITPVSTPVPLPAAIWLFGSGLLGFFGVRRRIRS